MIQLEQQQHGEFVGGWGVCWLTPTTYIQLAGAGSIYIHNFEFNDTTQKGYYPLCTLVCTLGPVVILIMRTSVWTVFLGLCGLWDQLQAP